MSNVTTLPQMQTATARIAAFIAEALNTVAEAVGEIEPTIENATTTTAGLMSAADKSKLDSIKTAKRYGYRIKKNEPDPYYRVEYLYDAVGMTPAHMDFEKGEFNYGSWKDIWFVADSKPCMLNSDGTVEYYLNPNDYTLKEDGTYSDVADSDTSLNAMAQIPLCWVYRYEDDDYLYEIVSPVQYDENYKAYAHTDADGNVKPYFYTAMFGASNTSQKLRSLSGKTLYYSRTYYQIEGAVANGDGWYIGSWSQRELIRTLLILIGKSCDSQAVFGNGNIRRTDDSEHFTSKDLLETGTLNDKGQFFGYDSNNRQVKVFHIEGFWGDQLLRTAGLILNLGTLYVKMTPPYIEITSDTVLFTAEMLTDYTVVENDLLQSTITKNYTLAAVSKMSCSEFGMLPTGIDGSTSIYFCDCIFSTYRTPAYLCAGACVNDYTNVGGAFSLSLENAVNYANFLYGCFLAYV